jgi:Gamma-glutamyl cyclotransferase, AIG2-like
VTERKVAVFLYGLFMDMDGLQQRGLDPSKPQVASLDGYDIAIRDRATVIPRTEARVYGIVTGLTHVEIDTLYAEPSVRDYRPEAVLVTREDGRQVPALCYTLPTVTGSHCNTTYAAKLLALATTLAFPEAYLATLQRLTQEETASKTGGEKQHDG